MRSLKLLLISIVITINVLAQQNIDSLLQLSKSEISDSLKIQALLKLANEYIYIDTDSALLFTDNASQIASAKEDTILIIRIETLYGYIYNTKGLYSDARAHFETVLNFATEKKDSALIGSSYGNIGNTYLYEKKSSLAIDYFLKALEIFENKNNVKGIATVYAVLGNLYLSLEKYDDALVNYKKGLELFQQIGWKSYAATSLMNIGIIYKNLNDIPKAIEHFNKAHNVHLELGNYFEAAQCVGNIGSVEYSLGNYNKSIEYHKKSLEALKKVNAIRDIGVSLMSIGVCYDSLKNYPMALNYYKESLENLDTTDHPSMKATLSYQIYRISKKLNDIDNALKYHELYMNYNDTIIVRENRKNLDEVLTKYETVQKEKEIEIQNEKIRRKNILVSSIFLLLVMLSVLAIVLYFSYRRKQKDNLTLEAKNKLINEQKEEILTQNEILQQQKEEIEAQRDEVVSQRDQITYQNHLITDSIEYAKHIQNAVLPSKKLLNEYFADSFILFKPRDIVSGDFYWIKRFEDHMIFALADCTGHGVPGAFMSMLGMTLLNDIVAEQSNSATNLILEELRTRVKHSLKQSGDRFEAKDGIEIAICNINLNKMELEYSGANIPLYIMRDNTLIEYLPTRNPIGYHPKEIAFERHLISLNKMDTLYLYSDGFMDQLGGDGYTKYKRTNLHNLLISIDKLPMEAQHAKINQTFEAWKGVNEQTDDILIMGIKI